MTREMARCPRFVLTREQARRLGVSAGALVTIAAVNERGVGKAWSVVDGAWCGSVQLTGAQHMRWKRLVSP